MTTPTTDAGRRLQDRLRVIHSVHSSEVTNDILDIERQAAEAALTPTVAGQTLWRWRERTLAEAAAARADADRLFSEVDNDPDEWHHVGGCVYCTGYHDKTEARSMNGNKVLRLLARAALAAHEATP